MEAINDMSDEQLIASMNRPGREQVKVLLGVFAKPVLLYLCWNLLNISDDTLYYTA